MKIKLKTILTRNLGIKILSLLLGCVLWAVIISIDDPTISATIRNVPVTILNQESIEVKDQVFEVVEGSTIDIYVSGRRTVVNSLKASDFTAVADLNNLYYDIVKIDISCQESAVEIRGSSDTYVKISLEDIISEQFRVVVVQTGVPEEGYAIGTINLEPTFVEVSGPRSVLERIEEIRVVMGISKASEDFTITLEPRAYDKNGEIVDASKLDFSDSAVSASVEVLSTKKVALKVKTVGSPPMGYSLDKIIVDPQQVEIAGDKEALSKISSIEIEVDVDGVTSDVEQLINVSDYIPQGVKLVQSDATASIRVPVIGLRTKEIVLQEADISIRNQMDGTDFSFGSNGSIIVTIMGKEDLMAQTTPEDLGAYLDLDSYSAGSYVLELKFNPPEGITITGSPTVHVVLSDGTEPPEEEGPVTP